jgi:uncharacterized protein (TIGR03905 family)
MYHYTTQGTCSRSIDIELDGERVESVAFEGGCNGNLKAIGKLVHGMTIDEVAALLEGNTCGRRTTSCADQLVRGLKEAREAEQVQRKG